MSIPSPEYWRERFELLEQIQNEDGRKLLKDIKKAYKRAFEDIEKDLLYWYKRFAKNEGISLEQAKKVLDAGQLSAFKMRVEEYIKKGESLDLKWRKELERASVRVHVSRLEAMKLQMQQHVEELTSKMAPLIDDYAQSSYLKQYYRSAYEIQKGVQIGWDLQRIDKDAVSKVVSKPWAADGTNFSDRIWDNRTKLVNELHTTLSSGIARGESPQKTIAALNKKMDNSEFNTGRVVMTEGAFFASAAHRDSFNATGVEKFRYVATLDFKTSKVCRDMDGMVFPQSEYEIGTTAPPLHPFCRSSVSPEFNGSEFFSGTRKARNEKGEWYEVPDTMTYHEWEKTFLDGGSKDGLKKTAPNADTAKGVQNLKTAFGDKHYEAMHSILEKNGTAEQKQIWEKLEPSLEVGSTNFKDTAHFRPVPDKKHKLKKGIHIDLEETAKGSEIEAPYRTAFHELGHHIDYVLGKELLGKDGHYFSYNWRDGELYKTIRKEANALIARYEKEHGVSAYEAKRIISEEIQNIPMRNTGFLSDVLNGVTSGSGTGDIWGGWGHSNRYWSGDKVRLVALESFAEYWECIANPEEAELFKQWLPNTFELFLIMMAEIVDGLSE